MKNILRSLFIIAVVVFIGGINSLNAQNKAIITGKVIDSQTNETLPGANIYFEGTTIGSVTDADGKFYISGVPAGNLVLVASYIGYEKYKESISVNAGETITKKIKLSYSGGTNLEDVVITAQAKGQMAAINQQLSSNEIKNVVSSDRIQELPDANAAESVGRLPGVSVLRSGGEGSKVVIRGMSPKYNKVMIDGMEIASTGSDDRSTNLSMISSYSLDGIEVTKSNTADHDADFVGGTVNFKLKTAEEGFHVDVIAQGSYNQLKTNFNNYNFVASISNRFFNNKLGIYLMGNTESRIRSANERTVETWFANSSQSLTEPNPIYASHLALMSTDRTRKRNGGTLVIDYRLNHGSIAFKNFVSSGKDLVQEYSQNYDVYQKSINYKTKDATYDVLTLNNLLQYDQQFGAFKVSAKAGHSFSKSSTPNDLSLNFYRSDSALVGIPDKDPGLNPDSIISYSVIDPSRLYANQFYNWKHLTEQRQYEVAGDLEWAFNISDKISGTLKMGGKYRHRTKKNDVTSNFSDVSSGSSGGVFNQRLTKQFPWMMPYVDDPTRPTSVKYGAYIDQNYDHGVFMKDKYGNVMGPVANIDKMHEVYDWISDTSLSHASPYVYRLDDVDSKQFDYSGFEDLYAGYLMGTFKITSFVDFIPGVRYESNSTSYTGPRGDIRATDPTRTHYGDYYDTTTIRNNSYFLPMLHLIVKPLSWLQVRLAYTKTLSRPNYSILVPKRHIPGDTKSAIMQNNYRLLPEEATNYDLNVSFHENHVGLFTVGLFSKDIKNKVFWTGNKFIGDNYEFYELDPSLQSYQINTQYNDTNGVKIYGIELDWQTQFWYLPGALKGFVLNINYTHIKSEAKYPFTSYKVIHGDWEDEIIVIDTNYSDRLIDQPDDILNISLGYDYKGFSGRVSMMYTNDIFNQSNMYNELRGYTGSYVRWDISVKQNLPVKGLQVFANLNNLSQRMDVSYIRGASYPVFEQHYGMTVDLGVRWRL